jgi:hypothetical protein
VGHVTCVGVERKMYKVLVRRPEGRRPLGRPRRRLDYVMKMDIRRLTAGCRVDSVDSR